MIAQLLAAVSFLTRIPVGEAVFSARDIGRSARWFPLVGLLLGAAYSLLVLALRSFFPATVVAVLIVVMEALLTGALHLDGLADMADGFGGGRTREDVLRIMRDHAIGAYGAAALILLIMLKVVCLAELIQQKRVLPYLFIAPSLARWSAVLLSHWLPYARRTPADGIYSDGSPPEFVGRRELIFATLCCVVIALACGPVRTALCWAGVLAVSAGSAALCRRRIQGITGDTLGANTEICEVVQFWAAILIH